MNADLLLETVADVLEKTAAYYESIEASRVAKIQQQEKQDAQKLAETISEALGEPLDDSLVDKLSHVTPEVRGILTRMAGDSGNVESLGGPETAKVAGADGLPPEDLRFISWLNS